MSLKFEYHRLVLSVVAVLAAFCGTSTGSAGINGELALKTNLLYDVALSPNLGIEVGLGRKWSVDISGNFNDWSIKGHQWKHWVVQPEARYWLCERFGGHFLAAHAVAGEYNFGHIGNNVKFLGSDFSQLSHKRYQGWGAGLGVGYGYTWMLSRHWSMEAEIAVGWIYTRYDSYPCANCGRRLEKNRVHNYVGPTKAALNLIYVF